MTKKLSYIVKKVLTLAIMLFAAGTMFSCNDDADKMPGPIPGTPQGGTPTEVGAPIGAQTSKIIGPNGGTISTPDGKLSLTFPQGAVTVETNITVQRVENKAWNGIGFGYEFGPDGSKFAKPVTFTYHYHEDEMNGATLDNMALAFQNKDRVWQLAQPVKVDKAAKTVTGRVNHFSWWSLVTQYHLEPEHDTVLVKQIKELTLTKLSLDGHYPYWEGKEMPASFEDDALLSLSYPQTADRLDIAKMYLNGVDWTTSQPKNQSYGTLGYAVTASEAKLLYVAPGKIPADHNPVAVSMELRHTGGAKLMLISNLVIAGSNTLNVDGTQSNDLTIDAAASGGMFSINILDNTSSTTKPVMVTASTSHFKVGKFAFDTQSTHIGALHGPKEKAGSSLYEHCNEARTEEGFIIIEKIYKDGSETKMKGQIVGSIVTDHGEDRHCNVTIHETMKVTAAFTCVVR